MHADSPRARAPPFSTAARGEGKGRPEDLELRHAIRPLGLDTIPHAASNSWGTAAGHARSTTVPRSVLCGRALRRGRGCRSRFLGALRPRAGRRRSFCLSMLWHRNLQNTVKRFFFFCRPSFYKLARDFLAMIQVTEVSHDPESPDPLPLLFPQV